MNSLLLVRFVRHKPLAQFWADASPVQARSEAQDLQVPATKPPSASAPSSSGHTTFILRHPSNP